MSDTIAPLCFGRCGLQMDDDVRPWLAILSPTGRGPRPAFVCPECEASGMPLDWFNGSEELIRLESNHPSEVLGLLFRWLRGSDDGRSTRRRDPPGVLLGPAGD